MRRFILSIAAPAVTQALAGSATAQQDPEVLAYARGATFSDRA